SGVTRAAWPAERLVGWAQSKRPKTAEVAKAILERGGHPESGRRACLGLMRLGGRHGGERLEAACGRALAIGSPTCQRVQAILKGCGSFRRYKTPAFFAVRDRPGGHTRPETCLFAKRTL